jgi:hypothetical protein
MIKQRYQNPIVGDTIQLLMMTYNSNNRVDVDGVESVTIYRLDKTEITLDNPDGRVPIESFTGSEIEHADTGEYYLLVTATPGKYVIGTYIDSWQFRYRGDAIATQENIWRIYPDLFFATPIPVVYDFSFRFRPNRIRKGSIRYIIIEVEPNVPNIADLKQYYLNLAVSSPLKISMERACGECMPQEQDLRLVIDRDDVPYRENCRAYYKLDTTEMDCGEYYVWFEMECGESLYLSDKQIIQIFN